MGKWHERKKAIREELEGLIVCKQAELNLLMAISKKLDDIKSTEGFENFVEKKIAEHFDPFIREELQNLVDNLGYGGLVERSKIEN
jgi:hypothetical protein